MAVTNQEIIDLLRAELSQLHKRVDAIESRLFSLESHQYGDTVFYD